MIGLGIMACGWFFGLMGFGIFGWLELRRYITRGINRLPRAESYDPAGDELGERPGQPRHDWSPVGGLRTFGSSDRDQRTRRTSR